MNESTLKTGKFLLDTNCVIATTTSETVSSAIYELGDLFVPAITIGELAFGAFNSRHVNRNLSKIEALIRELPVIDCDAETAMIYGRIRLQLKQKGRPIPSNDIWIAAIALQHDLVLVTKDRHFQNIEELSCRDW